MTEAHVYQVLARKYRPGHFRDLIGQEAMVRVLTNAFEHDRIAHAFILTGVRGVGKTTTARIIAKGLNCQRGDRPTIDPCDECEALHRDRRGPPRRRAGDRRRVEQRRRQHPRDQRRGALPGGFGALQGLYHRRSAHAVDLGLQRASENARGTARALEVPVRNDRDPQGAGHGPVALPALRPAPDRARSDDRTPARHSRQGRRDPGR